MTTSPEESTSLSMLDFALRYAAMGWWIVPCHSVRAGRCSCGNNDKEHKPGKHPRT